MNQELIKLTNEYLSNILTLYMKIHHLHWNIYGKEFKEVHKYLEELYNECHNELDEIAEIIIIKKNKPISSLKECLALSEIEELTNNSVDINEALRILLKDIEFMKTKALKIKELSDQENIFSLSNKLEDYVSKYEKNIWFISSMLGGKGYVFD